MGRAPILYVTSLSLLIVLAACGSSKFDPNNVSVSVSPSTASVAANGQVSLQATVLGLSQGVNGITLWTITEDPSSSDCAVLQGIDPVGPCPAGTIQIANADELTVTYTAPSTPGSYHVNAEWEYFTNFSGPPTVTKTATAIVNVTP